MGAPLGLLEYLYLGTADFERDCQYYSKVLGAERVWAFHAFGAKVAAFRVCTGPLFLVADHRLAPSCMPVMAVDDLGATVSELKERGWKSEGDVFEIPHGRCYRFIDTSGNRFAVFQNDRSDVMENAFADPTNAQAIRK